MPYGYELILDIKDADSSKLTRDNVDAFFTAVCEATEMERVEAHFWDDAGEELPVIPNPKVDDAISAVCFIMTSSITVHALRILGEVYINIFTCKGFDPIAAHNVAQEYFGGTVLKGMYIQRG